VLRERGASDVLSPPSAETRRARRRIRRLLLTYLGLAPFVVIAIFPIYWMAITAFKEDADLYRMDLVPFWFHMAPTLAHFRLLFHHTYFSVWFLNTIALSLCLVLVTLVTAVPAAYALARLRLPGSGHLGIAMFMTYLVPPIIIFLPLARIVGERHERDEQVPAGPAAAIVAARRGWRAAQ
jgi:ABC-type glycerol-3-phosphate transport system permease component